MKVALKYSSELSSFLPVDVELVAELLVELSVSILFQSSS